MKSAPKVLILQGVSAPKNVTHVSFALLSLRRIVSFVLFTTGWTIYLSRRTNVELFSAAFALFCSAADKLRIEIKINRQNDISRGTRLNAVTQAQPT